MKARHGPPTPGASSFVETRRDDRGQPADRPTGPLGLAAAPAKRQTMTINLMAFTYTTRRGKTYYLHTGPKRGGGVQHYVSTQPADPAADSLPEGFEVYETPNG